MEFRKMLMITLYAEQKKRHRFIEQSRIFDAAFVIALLTKELTGECCRA